MQLTTEQLAVWERDGIIVVPNVFSPDTIAPALEEMEHNAYDGVTYAEYRAKWDPQPDALKSAYEKNSDLQLLAGRSVRQCIFRQAWKRWIRSSKTRRISQSHSNC